MIAFEFYFIVVDKTKLNMKKIYFTFNMYCCQTYIFKKIIRYFFFILVYIKC
jgi:hypothetical protein